MVDRERDSASTVTVDVAFGERGSAFHREPDMDLSVGGFLAINNEGGIPIVTYYLVETPDSIGWGILEDDHIPGALDDWRNGLTEAPKSSKYTIFTPKWQKLIDPSTGQLAIETKDKEGVRPMVINVQTIEPQPVQ